VENLLSAHTIYYKADHKYALCFERAPLQKLQFAGTSLSKGPPTATAI